VSACDRYREDLLEWKLATTLATWRCYRNFIRINCGHSWSEEIEQAVIRQGQILAR